VVKERLGHSSIVTTQKYLAITLDETDETAIDALSRIRNRGSSPPRAGVPAAWADPEDPGGHGAGASRVPAAGSDTALARHGTVLRVCAR
jgi:hypothetical protein